MKYFATAVSIVLLASLAWVIFFSGAVIKKSKLPEPPKATKASYIVILETNFGLIKIQTNPEVAPKTSANFEKLVKDGFYNGLTFHRIVPGFVIQGGDPKGDGTGGPGYTLPAEIKLLHKRGAVAMARLPDAVNPQRESSGSQFYISLTDLPGLDGQYTVFGQVVSGMDTADQIATVKTDQSDKPLELVIIKKAYLE